MTIIFIYLIIILDCLIKLIVRFEVAEILDNLDS